jgi:hypothetical protein
MIESSDQVVPLSIGLLPVTDVPSPILLQNEYDAYLVFDAHSEVPSASSGIAIVRLQHCLITRFGYPNDEALEGHPLYPRGLGFYGAFEVNNSSWLAQLQEQNRRRFPEYKMPHRRHIVITFHDSMFEGLADAVHASLTNENRRSVLGKITQLLWGDA